TLRPRAGDEGRIDGDFPVRGASRAGHRRAIWQWSRRQGPHRCRGNAMSLKVAVQMDPVRGINIETDTTFLMMMEAQARGHSLWVYEPDRLSLEDGQVSARGHALNLRAVKGDHAELGEMEVRLLKE